MKQQEKMDVYTNLKYEILKFWKNQVSNVEILPIVIGTLGTMTGNVKRNIEKLGCFIETDVIQKVSLLGKTSQSRVENQQTQPTGGVESGNRSRATAPGGKASALTSRTCSPNKLRLHSKFNHCEQHQALEL